MLEKIGPTTKSTLSRSTSALTLVTATSGLSSSSGDDHLDLAPAELAAERLDREIEAVAELLADHGRRPGQCGDDADLELFLRLRGRTCQTDRRGGEQDQSLHFTSCLDYRPTD